ncbi:MULTISPECIES: adenosylmethionine--8-amino-7-oxononanoate transaminase [unclassified Idiomarina]|uniref:adenosylmethionine--8-amino-7-oxononanoate transaminase n=1 Tax=unclassified Idiomarina TaxID=2614829 RepID=UPI000C917DB1|nr:MULTISPECIES: adenosylmethionine--8-amino-7-oxononanoate transaminase [unclassified Idiomarina]MAD54500.1 adenosylmethionine--8-amino-7-oxononanoate transaminase [Idiomarinaceae bacterium]NQZ04936.1 adenosylmethionine--8-amino-7-oxononanoate transaminase [Idiomarina sp.]
MSKSLQQAIEFDQQHIWHPYTSMTDPLPCYHVASAHGCEITLSSGERLVDGMSSWWAAIHGYNHPQLNAAVHAQADKMSHVMFGGLTHQPAIEMVERLIDLTPAPLDRVFIADSGSVSVEVAIKMALQYWFSIEQPEKSQLLTIRGGYHGDTFAAMSVCDPVNGMHHMFRHALCNQRFVERPAVEFGAAWDPSSLNAIQQELEQHHGVIAAVIVEPVVQGAGGMRFYHPEYLKQLRRLCDQYNVLLIADEIATGFGRTGQLFGCDHAGIVPDIMCVGKALTGGYMTLAATLTHAKVAEAIGQGQGGGALMHGPTFMGNPLACAVASASLALIQQGNWRAQVQQIEQQLIEELIPLNQHPEVNNVRVLGAIGVVELNNAVDVARTQALFVELGVWIRPFGRLMYIMPPYCISTQQLSKLTHAIAQYLKSVTS